MEQWNLEKERGEEALQTKWKLEGVAEEIRS
jgi:hypothetical protein